ncbi:single-stranded DNA-binding protein [Mycoplasmatota bacterium]|nr:single-stranded DNA-binding protein [Mycoplasmatota bacterium]
MLNQVIIVGRLVKDPEVKTTSDEKKVSHITLAVNRSYKNNETGKYDTDFIYCTLWEGVAQATANHCKKGSIIGIKGRLITKSIEIDTNKKINYPDLIAERVTFISSGKDHSQKELGNNLQSN